MTTEHEGMTAARHSMNVGRVFAAIGKACRASCYWIPALGLLALATPALAQCPLSFNAPSSYAAGTNPRSVAVGDFNADGRPDLAVANYFSNNVSVLLNTGSGFPPPVITQQP